MKSIKKVLATLALIVFVLLYALNAAAFQLPEMQLRVAIPKLTLWSEPTNKSTPVKDVENKSVRLKCGDIVYEMPDQFGRTDYGDFISVRDENGNYGYACKKYLVYGYKILLQGSVSQDIYRNEWGVLNNDQGIGAVTASRKNEELIVIGETTNCLQVLTVEEPESVSGYISRYAYYSYVYDYDYGW